jgi:hypothetical protein
MRQNRILKKLEKYAIKLYKQLSPENRAYVHEFIYKKWYQIDLEGTLGVISNGNKTKMY